MCLWPGADPSMGVGQLIETVSRRCSRTLVDTSAGGEAWAMPITWAEQRKPAPRAYPCSRPRATPLSLPCQSYLPCGPLLLPPLEQGSRR